ncbi:zf-HC2 domain-containing protein [Bacillus cereus]|uniref:zf-HC2 domain-containing protein n=1 Tax=Bacillus cereus TaxID=1396 RepID=UPI000BF472FF|nr:zf-HC2 domain-containing protein [Bacillus cereus]PFA86236.1 hypothetical protein CN393_23215 [Bacillus cereus]
MHCFNIGLIQAYIDGELPHETRKKFMEHLDTCEVCQKSLLKISKLNLWEDLVLNEESKYLLDEIKVKAKGDVDQVWGKFKHNSPKNASSPRV